MTWFSLELAFFLTSQMFLHPFLGLRASSLFPQHGFWNYGLLACAGRYSQEELQVVKCRKAQTLLPLAWWPSSASLADLLELMQGIRSIILHSEKDPKPRSYRISTLKKRISELNNHLKPSWKLHGMIHGFGKFNHRECLPAENRYL